MSRVYGRCSKNSVDIFLLDKRGQTVYKSGQERTGNMDLMTKNELAAAFKIHPRTVQRWTKQYEGFPFFRIGNRMYFEFDAVLNFWKTRQ